MNFAVVIMTRDNPLGRPNLTQVTYADAADLCEALANALAEAPATVDAARRWAGGATPGDWFDFPGGWVFAVKGAAASVYDGEAEGPN